MKAINCIGWSLQLIICQLIGSLLCLLTLNTFIIDFSLKEDKLQYGAKLVRSRCCKKLGNP